MSEHVHDWLPASPNSDSYRCNCGALGRRALWHSPIVEFQAGHAVVAAQVADREAVRAAKRAELAADFMRDIVRANAAPADGVWQSPPDCAEYAVQCADALFAALDRSRTP